MALLTELGNSFALVLQRCRPNGAERQSAGNFFSSASRWVKVFPDMASLRLSIKRLSIVRIDPFTVGSKTAVRSLAKGLMVNGHGRSVDRDLLTVRQ